MCDTWIDVSPTPESNHYWEVRVPPAIYNQRSHFFPRRKENMQTTNKTSNNFRKQNLA